MERFLEYFVPEKYELDFDINKKAKTIDGVVVVSGEVKSEMVKFHAVGFEIKELLLNSEKGEYDYDSEVLTIRNVKEGPATFRISYAGKLNENMEGAYLSTYEYKGKTETIVATQFESHYAREAFPCIDEPAAKAEFDVKITTDDADDLILVNTPSPRMSTYLLAFVVGKFHGKTITNAHGVEITTYTALNQDVNAVDFANEIAARSLEFYDDNFGVPYPLKKLVQVALPDFEAGAMENWGLVTYRESMLLALAGESATLGTYKSVALTVAHELSHQWFGDLVTMEWWDDLWLNESFASVMEYYAVDFIHPEYRIFEGFFTGDALAALKRDALTGVQSVHQEVHNPAEIATLFDPAIVYSKGARLMLMVIRAMGWGDFCRGIREYFEKYQYGNTVGDNLWEALGHFAKFDVGEMMHAFIDQPGYPVVTNTGIDFEKFDQRRFLLDGEMKESNWPLAEITEDMSGHYVLNLSEKEFNERLARFDTLGLEEKLRLLIDRDLISKTELKSNATLLPLLSKFKNETSAAVWNIIITMVSGLKIFLESGTEEEKLYKKFVKELVRPELSRFGIVTRKDDDENTIRLRAILLALDFYASTGEPEAQENLRKLAELYNADFVKIDTEIRNDVLDAKLYLEPECYEEFLEAYKKTADPEIKFDLLFAVTLSDDMKVLEKAMKLLEQPEVVKPQDQFSLFIYLFRNPKLKVRAFSWLTSHWNYVKNMAGDKSLENYPRYTASSIRTDEEYKMWREFFEPLATEPAISRAVMVGKNEIEARLKLIREDGERVRQELQAK